MNRILFVLFVFLAQLAGIAPAVAADSAIDVTMQAFKVVATARGTELQKTDAAQPGDTIEYQVVYRNSGKTVARNVVAVLPVPAGGMAYLPDSATPATVEASLDGKQFAPVPLQRTVVRAGRSVTEPVPPAEYRFLRWNLGELPAGQTSTVKSRMRLNGATVSKNDA
jgi:uncharacterized repeat protein (TIGR01451 family)